ncbi:hypothetical protein AC249_AIPGENE22423 [Exaiptasia diaphana]|nr:hypothetical protein AC249_AIPGENE22423 [Exaiptasia diaphana]
MVFVDEDGQVTFHFQNYKTVKTYGADQTVLKPDHELAFIMRDYLKKHRQTLINEESADYLLVVSATTGTHVILFQFTLTLPYLPPNPNPNPNPTSYPNPKI